MRRLLRISVAITMVAGVLFSTLASSVAEARGQNCYYKTIRTDTGIKQIMVCDGDDGGDSDGSGKMTREKCMRFGVEVPCTNIQGTWYAPANCWIRLADPQPPKDHPAWQGRTEGALYTCWTGLGGSPTFVWLPAGDPPPDPAVLAARAVSQMNLRAPKVGIVPESRPGYRGAVGLPVWLWVDDPGPSVTGPISRTASLRGYSVTATGRLDRIVYSMGDGKTVTCSGTGAAGTRYKDSYGVSSSPTCGYRYSKQGGYRVTATAYWLITWTGMGQDGELDYEFTRSVQIVIGEIQVLVTGGKGR